MVVRFGDIGGIVDHHCLNFLFIIIKKNIFSEALKGMEAVAEHINEMQKIFEEYGSVFDELSKMFREIHPQKKVNILLM